MRYNLSKLFKEFGVTGVHFDSRQIKSGDAFIAIKGENVDGNLFIADAVKRGAKLIISEDKQAIESSNFGDKDKIFYVDNAAIILAAAAALFYPTVPETLIAVTGTNGKTSVVSYCQQLFGLFGMKSCSIGTLGVQGEAPKGLSISDGLTTPDILSFRKILHFLALNKVSHVAFEASSHGIEQHRLHGIRTQLAAFTSFSHDHLDYHKTLDNYLHAKLKLFLDNLAPNGSAVVNSELLRQALVKQWADKSNQDLITVGETGKIRVNLISIVGASQLFSFSFNQQEYEVVTEIVGAFQVTNLLIAAALVHKSGVDFGEIVKKLPQVKAVRGRLERVTSPCHPFQVFIDYAHTPEALRSSLLALNKFKVAGKLKVIFGCGGDRDTSKRALMGSIAAAIADEVIITDDNPRNEEAAKIRKEILQGALMIPDCNCSEIEDRQEAIAKIIKNMQPGDILLIAGKGHEEYQLINNKKIECSDIKIAKTAIAG